MATITIGPFSGTSRYMKLSVWESSVDQVNNTSVVNYSAEVYGDSYYYDSHLKVILNGETVYERTCGWDGGFPAQPGTISGSRTITHNADGTKSVSFSIIGYANVYSDWQADGSINLTAIDRTAPTVTTGTPTANTTNNISISGSANANCDIWEYSLDGGSWTTFSTTNGTSASGTLSVSEGTHSVNIRARKASNHFYGTGTAKSVDTARPTVTTGTPSINSANSLTIRGTANANCDKWEYSLDNGSWTEFSTINGTSAAATISVTEGTHSVNIRARKTSNHFYGTGTAKSVDTARPTITATISNILTDRLTISATANSSCNLWEYTLDNGQTWTTFSTTSGTSASVTVTGLEANTNYLVAVRAKKTANGLYGQNSSVNVKTLGGAVYVSDNYGHKKAICYVSDGTRYKAALAYIYTLDGWKLTEY